MSVFNFDEDSFGREFGAVIIDLDLVEDHLEDHHEEHLGPHDGVDKPFEADHLQPQSYYRDESSSAAIPIRRKSAVLRRLSVKLVGSFSSVANEIHIPQGYDNSVHRSKKLLGDFRPIKVLGQGAYGKVYLIQDKTTGKLFAQKQLRKPTINIINNKELIHAEEEEKSHSSHVNRTILERDILTNITHHPNIVKLFYALQDHDKFYLILEYIPGGELFHHLTSSKNALGNVFKEDHVAFYAAQMALAIKHLHGLGIVYRDLKPENCLLNSSGHLVLTDFGLSKTINEDDDETDSRCHSIIGTPEYMAPEVLKGDEYDFKVDWWSLGCVIYDMMSGKPPFTGNSHKAIQDKIIKNKLKLPYYFSMDAKDLLNKLLNKTPEKRFPVDKQWETFTKHRFFRKINWKELELQTCTPPLVPVITDPILAENFLDEFTGMKLSINEENGSWDVQDNQFKGFSYTASESFISRYMKHTT